MGKSVIIIGEIGINHNGDIDIAKKLIDMAVFAKIDAVKFQKRNIDKVYTQEYLNSQRESPWGTTQREQKEGLEFSKEEYNQINRYCAEREIDWFASAWDLDSVRFLEQYNLKYNKIASPMLTHKKLLEAVARQKKYTFISTGMSTMQEISEAVSLFKSFNCSFELMHCNSQYPMPDKDANLKCIPILKKQFDCKVGYSDHSPGIMPSVIAVVLGATSIEKHITLDRSMYGSDQASSVELMGLYKLVDYIRLTEVVLGDGVKKVTEGEEKIKAKLRRVNDVF